MDNVQETKHFPRDIANATWEPNGLIVNSEFIIDILYFIYMKNYLQKI